MKNIYLRLIEYGEKHPDGFNHEQITNEFNHQDKRQKGIIKKHLSIAFNNTRNIGTSGKSLNIETIFLLANNDDDEKGKKPYELLNFLDENCRYIINLESSFKYIDYQELVTARKMAKQASENAEKSSKYAKIAIGIAIVTFIASIIFSVRSICISKKQIETPIKIDQSQLKILLGKDIK